MCVKFSYFNIIRGGVNIEDFSAKARRLNYIYSIYESLSIAIAVKCYKINIKYNKIMPIILIISLLVSYLGIRSDAHIFLMIENRESFILSCIFKIGAIGIKVYILKYLVNIKSNISSLLYRYLNTFLVIRIIMQFTTFLTEAGVLKIPLSFLDCILLCVSHYIVLKMMISEIISNPYYNIYRKLITKSKNLKRTTSELLEVNRNFQKVKQEEVIKNELLANISHEFKTPVNVIYSAIQTKEILDCKGKSDLDNKYNNIIKQNCNRLIRLINNFIDTTRLDKGSIQADLKLFNVVSLTEKIAMSIIPYAESKNLKVIFDTSDEELYTFVDEQLYERVLLNILSNSIKYSKDTGDINIYVDNSKNKIQITIKDHGIGMNEDDLQIIFNRFERLDKTLSRNTEGSGLGLHIVKGIIKLLKGNIEISSKKDIGTIVKLEFDKYIPTNSEIEKMRENEFVLINHKHETEIEMSDIYF